MLSLYIFFLYSLIFLFIYLFLLLPLVLNIFNLLRTSTLPILNLAFFFGVLGLGVLFCLSDSYRGDTGQVCQPGSHRLLPSSGFLTYPFY